VSAVLRSYDGIALRQLRTRRLRAVLTSFGVVLGVGMVFGVLLLVGTIRATFNDLIDSAWGSKDLIATPATAGVLPQASLERIRATPGVRSAGAMVGAVFVRLDRSGRAIRGNAGRMMVAGYDPRQSSPYDFRLVAGRGMRSGAELDVERGWAQAHHIRIGQQLAVGTPVGPRRLRVVGFVALAGGASFGGEGLAIMPLDAARPIMAMPSGWLQISIVANDRRQASALRARLERALGPGVKVQAPQAYGKDISDQLRALDMVLYFFSGVALFVGGFLILNSFAMTILQRTRELGMLRTLGASRRMIVRSVLLEAAAIGVVGGIAGLGLGLGLSLGLIALMKGIGIPIGSLQITPSAAVIAFLVGILTTVVGAWRPARRAGRVPPIRAILGQAESQQRPGWQRALVGLALFLPGALLGGSLWFGNNASSALTGLAAIAVTIVMFLGMVIAAPSYIMPLVRGLGLPLRRLSPTGGRLAADTAGGNPRRTAATAAALTIGLSVVVVNAGMSQSFIGTIRDQIDRGYARDVTVQPAGSALEQGGAQTIAPGVRAQVAALPAAGVVTPLRLTLLPNLPGVTGGKMPGLVEGVDPVPFARVDRTAVSGASRAAALAGLARGDVLVGTFYAKRVGLHVGDHVTLRGPRGTHQVRVAGILRSLVFNGQVIQVSLATMRGVYGITSDAQLLVQARSPGLRKALARQVDGLIARRHPELEALSTAQVKQQIDDAVTRQFNLFNAIVAIAIIVSILGVINTLAISVTERTRDIGLLRALGSSRALVRLSTLDESLLITVSGALAGVVLGTGIAWMWVRSLGGILPGIAFRFPAGTVVGVAILAVVLGTVAALLPARRAARIDVLEAVRYE
jgi:putative ABC transport system permease protein